MWYLTSLFLLLVLAGAGWLTGGLLTVWLPARMQPAARVFLRLPLGCVLLTLVATFAGWIGHGYAAGHCTAVTVLLAALGAWAGRGGWRHAGGDALRLAAFCVFASFPVLGPLLLHGSFSVYNDTFLYHGQALWLQHHGFREPADVGGGHPLWGTVYLMQVVPLRMGASFLLGWTQAACGLELPHGIFPAVAALGVVCGALGVGATLLAACPGRWPEAWLAALAAAVTLNGFAFGAANGFLPQTWGLALASAAFGLRGLEPGTRAERSGHAPWRTGVPLGVCAAAAIHCYWDVLPFAVPALVGTYLLPWPGRDATAWREVGQRIRTPLLTTVLLVNVEWLRAVRGILYNLHALAAQPVDWSTWDFLGHALGLKSSAWERSRWIVRDLPPGLLLAGWAVVVVWLGLTTVARLPGREHHWWRPLQRATGLRWPPLTPALVWLAMSGLLFAYYRWVVPSPWHGQAQGVWRDGTGQSWNQFKLTQWGSLAAVGLTAALATGSAMRASSPVPRKALITLLTLWCGTGLGWNFRVARWRGEEFLLDTGNRQTLLAACLDLRRQAAAVPAGDWIYLDWPPGGRGNHLRQLAVSLLFDHHVASDWSTDSAFLHSVAPEDAGRTPADCQWTLRYRPPGGMTLEQTPRPPHTPANTNSGGGDDAIRAVGAMRW